MLHENAPVGLYRTAPDGSILLTNAALAKMLGFSSSDELLARNLDVDGFDPAYPRGQFVERIEKEGMVSGLEAAWTRRDGTTVIVRESARAIRDPDGKTLFYDGTVEDITERKKSEDALRESEDRYRSLVDNVPGIIFTMDLAGKITFVSRRVGETLGYEAADVINKSVLDFVPEEDRQRAERKRAEEALRESETHYRTIFENAIECIFESTADGKVIAANPAFARLLGYESEEDVVRSLTDLPRQLWAVPGERDRVKRMIEEQGSVYGYECDLLRKDGSKIAILMNATSSHGPDELVRLHGSFHDITERKRAEEVLRESERSARARAEELHLAAQVNTAITTGLDLERLMQTVHEQCQLLFPIDTFYIVLYDEATDSVSFPFMHKDGERRSLPSRCLRVEPGLLEQVIRGGQTVYLPDAAHSPTPMVRQPGIVSQSIVAVPMALGDRVIGVLSMQSQLPDVYSQGQIQMFERLAAQVAIAVQNSRLYEAVSHGLEATLTALGRTAERRDPYTAGHQRRVTDLALAIARKLEYGEDACSALRTAGMLHDIGKLGVPAEILSKPTALSKIEFELIRT
ncbi:MAG: PAS domain S-box protein, partial [Candidatus Bipolaricaulota bacterium]|nr:PAS domain S-box protein [Candidatus Bipolaricaulota bacterium]